MPSDPQLPTIVRPGDVTTDVAYEPPLRVGFGLSDETVPGSQATMGRTILVPGAGRNPRHYHAGIDVCWYILYGQVRLEYAHQDGCAADTVILKGGDFVYIPRGAIHVISTASDSEEASLIFCYIGVGNVKDAQTVWLEPDRK